MNPTQKFSLLSRSAIIRSEKPNKGLDAIAAPNPQQMNRIVGFLPDGTKVVVAQRPGKGGMDFNKLLGGKVFAVAADALSPVYEKGPDGKPTRNQKQENGMPLYSSSGFYTLSSREYPALKMFEAYTTLRGRGEQVLIVTDEQLAASESLDLDNEFDWELASSVLGSFLADEHNLVAPYDVDMNRKRRRGIERAKEEAEDLGESYTGVEFAEVSVSKKDGNPIVVYAWRSASGKTGFGTILREADILSEEGRYVTRYFTPAEALEHFLDTQEGKDLLAVLSEEPVHFSFAQGHLMRTSVSFRRKCENVFAAPADLPAYGDAVYIKGATDGWVKGLVSLMHSMHPNFPNADYDAHHYVAAPRQAEVGLDKTGDGKWMPPKAPHYDLKAALLK